MELILAGIGVPSLMYTLYGAIAMARGITTLEALPQSWYTAAGIGAAVLVLCVVQIFREAKAPKKTDRQDPRRLGVIRYVDGRWVPVREDEEK